MPDESNALIGHITQVTGQYFDARLVSDNGDFKHEREVDGGTVRVGQVGSYVRVSQSGTELLTLVERLWQETDRDGQPRHMVRLTPLGELSEQGRFVRGVSHFPTTGAELHLVSVDTLTRVFADNSDIGYGVGRLTAFDQVEVFFDATSLFSRHFAVLGQTGAGKSWTVTSLIQSALKVMPNAHIILMDLHGEYGGSEDDPDVRPAFPREKVRYLDARELEIPYWLLSYAELIELLIDTDDPNASIQIAYLRGQVLHLKREAARDSDLGHVTVDSPVYFSLKELFEAFEKANRETTAFGKNKTPLYGKFDQLLVRLQSLFNDTRYDFLLQPKKRQTSESLAQLMRDFVGLGDPAANVTVLDLSAVPFDVAPIVTAQIGRLAYEFNYWNPRCDEFPILLVCEEAHEYIPRLGNPLHQQARRTIERIAKNGRKYGVGLCVISQRPHELSETVLSQCGTFLCLRISNPDDQEYVRKLVPDAARGILASLTALARGEVIAMGEAVPMPVRFRVTRPNPPPDSSDIDYAKQWAAGPRDISVEALVSRWRRQTR